jgi:uncharacterized iron-regulated protein
MKHHVLVFLMAAGAAAAPGAQAPPGADPTYVPQRVHDSSAGEFVDFEVMLVSLAKADVVFVGEQHDDSATHRLERAVLEGLARRRRPIVVALEMFERDVQSALDEYLSGRLAEFAFLRQARPWPRYDTDYRPLVELAKYRNWPVIAANVPRRLASAVGKSGLEAVSGLSTEERALIARDISCPEDGYFRRFADEMQAHPASGHAAPDQAKVAEQQAMVKRFYEAQCIKDETMAESVAHAFVAGGGSRPVIVHFNGAFHSDYFQGAAQRTMRRLPDATVRVITMVPVDDLDTLRPEEHSKRADFVVFTLRPSRPAPIGTGR